MTREPVASTPPATPPAVQPHPARWRILGFLGVAQLMLILDVTVVARSRTSTPTSASAAPR